MAVPPQALSVHTIAFGAVPFADITGELLAAGLRRVGVPVAQLETGDAADGRAALAEFDVLDLVEPAVFTVAEPSRWAAQRDRLSSCVALAGEVGADVLYLTTGPAGDLEWDEAADRFAAAIAPIVPQAAAAGVTLAVENTLTLRADISMVFRLADAVDLARLAGIAVCADLFAAWTERGLAATIAAGVDTFALVQVADYVLGTFVTPGRAVPGDGAVPLHRQLEYLQSAGYGGPLEVELAGPRIDAEGPLRACVRGLDALRAML